MDEIKVTTEQAISWLEKRLEQRPTPGERVVFSRECKYRHGKERYTLMACLSERYAEKLIAADIAPVRHGWWIFEPDGGTRCSECNKRVRDATGGLNAPVDLSELPYCPKCGAKMDWKGGEAE